MRPISALLVTAALAAFFSGCYLAHPREGEADADWNLEDGALGPDAAASDAGRDDGRDAGPPPVDAGVDAGRDAGEDSGPADAGSGPADGGIDAGRDGGVDAGRVDAGLDAGRDGGVDGGRDAGFEDGGVDAGPVDAGPERPALRVGAGTFFFMSDSPTFDLARESTFELWVRSRQLGDADFCGKGNRLARDLIVGQREGRIVAGWQVAGVPYFATGPAIPANRWVHVAIVRRPNPDGTHAVELIVDGDRVDEVASLPRLVGAFNDIVFRCGLVDADIDEIRLWRVARAAEDIRATFTRRISGGIPGLQHYWRLDERGQLLIDYTPRGLVGVNGRLTTPDPADATWIVDGAI